ncbi:hypothetical protein ACFX1Q_009943 [Malus domestica]
MVVRQRVVVAGMDEWLLEWMNGCGKEGFWLMVAAARWGKGSGGVEWCLKEEDGGWNGSKAAAKGGFG